MYKIDFSTPIHIYFVGIGGISMSGLAEILLNAGFRISGSDWKESSITQKLTDKGIRIFYGEDYAHITDDIDLAVLTSAVHESNLEFQAIRQKNIPYISRAELLGQIMKNYKLPVAVSGTHGKTTTTSMISQILLQADTDPTLSVGGILNAINGNVRVGNSDIFVTEACEYTNSFLSFFPKIGLILNIEEDHLDFFKDLEDIRNAFRRFAQLIPADGVLIINGEIPRYQEITSDLPCQILTFGHSAEFDFFPSDVVYNEMGCASFEVCQKDGTKTHLALSVPGDHNILNALAAFALSRVLSLDPATAAHALKHFEGTGRRFEYKGSLGGTTIIDDYAHHPTEITATLTAAQNYPHKKLWCVFQPHTFSRTKAFLTEFARALTLADEIVLADIYAARETDSLGISSADLQKEIEKLGHKCYYFPSFDEIENFLLKNCIDGDLLITMGAGDVLKIGENLLKK